MPSGEKGSCASEIWLIYTSKQNWIWDGRYSQCTPSSLLSLWEKKSKTKQKTEKGANRWPGRQSAQITSYLTFLGTLLHGSPGSFAGKIQIELQLAGELISTSMEPRVGMPSRRYFELSHQFLLAINKMLLQSLNSLQRLQISKELQLSFFVLMSSLHRKPYSSLCTSALWVPKTERPRSYRSTSCNVLG